MLEKQFITQGEISMEKIKLYSLKEVSEITSVSRKTLWQIVKDGKLKAVKIGREYRISEANLLKFINGD